MLTRTSRRRPSLISHCWISQFLFEHSRAAARRRDPWRTQSSPSPRPLGAVTVSSRPALAGRERDLLSRRGAVTPRAGPATLQPPPDRRSPTRRQRHHGGGGGGGDRPPARGSLTSGVECTMVLSRARARRERDRDRQREIERERERKRERERERERDR